MSTTRRTFLASGLCAGAAAPFVAGKPSWLQAAANQAGPTDAVLVVVQIRGGWDALQLLPEVDHPVYRAARPTIGLQKAKVLPLATGAAHYWHPAAQPFKALFDRGDLALIENIGYPQPNLSHFSSEKKWYAADPTLSTVDEGWLATYLKKGYTGSFSMPAINLEGRLNPAFLGERVPVFQNPALFQFLFDNNTYSRLDAQVQMDSLEANARAARTGHPNLLYIAGSTVDAVSDSDVLQKTGTTYTPRATYPASTLSNYLQYAARYITGGLQTKVYYTSHGGFDTHGNEVVAGATETGTFATRIAQVTGPIQAFLDDMKAYGVEKRVVVMVFSEFARRLGENGSLGTDHGHGGIAFLAGEPVIGGRYGTPPDLSQATTPYNNYYIPFNGRSTDFRRMYWDVLKWLNVQDPATILGQTFTPLGAVS